MIQVTEYTLHDTSGRKMKRRKRHKSNFLAAVRLQVSKIYQGLSLHAKGLLSRYKGITLCYFILYNLISSSLVNKLIEHASIDFETT